MTTLSITNNDLFRLALAGAISLVVASLFIGASHPLGYGVSLLALLVLTINSGVELDFEQLKYRKFKSVLGIKSGEWKSYNPQHQLVLLSKHGAKTMVNQRLISELSIEDYFYELYIMDPSTRKYVMTGILMLQTRSSIWKTGGSSIRNRAAIGNWLMLMQ